MEYAQVAMKYEAKKAAAQTPFILGCDFSQSLNALFKRVCQPAPVSLNAPTMSASRRMLTSSLDDASAGLPRLGLSISCAADWPNNPVKTSDAGRALANYFGGASDASVCSNSGLGLRGISDPFTLVCPT